MSELPVIDRRTALQHLALLAAAGGLSTAVTGEAAPRVLPEGQLPNDRRLGELKDLNGYFPFQPPASTEEWAQRAEYVHRQILVACGLWPMPPRPEIKPTIHGLVDRPEYTVEKVYFESSPGMFVTGSLYRPKGESSKPRPGILCPHGHWANGRFYDAGPEGVKKQIELGAEKFEVGGRYPLQARCVQLARMGCVVFHYDMIGYADSAPIGMMAHGFAKQRPELSSPEKWGLFSAQSELRLINAFGMQTFHSLRALDFLLSLPGIDPKKIGVTGASGGGTQTMIQMAIDDRVAAAFPAVMVSTAMQGGCTCENASYLRIDTGNIEFAAMAAPKPIAMTGANDWTREIETKGLPQLKQHFELFGVPEKVEAKYYNFDHNYNAVSRKMMYEFFNKTLDLGIQEPIEERDYTPLSREELSVWDESHPKPAMDEAAELAVVSAIAETAHKQIGELAEKRKDEFRKVVEGALGVMIGRGLPKAGQVHVERRNEVNHPEFILTRVVYRYRPKGEEVPAVQLVPKNWNRQVVVWVTDLGKQGLFETESPIPAVKSLLDAGFAVIGIDTLYQGEFLPDGQPLTEARRVKNEREFAGFTYGYNHPLVSQRVHDILTAIAAVKYFQTAPVKVHVAGFGLAGTWAALATVIAGDAVEKRVLATNYRFRSITNIRDPQLLPGAVKYGDVPAFVGLSAPHPVFGTDNEAVQAVQHLGGKAELFSGLEQEVAVAAAKWLATG